VTAEIEMRRGFARAVSLCSITHPLHTAQRMDHPGLWMGQMILMGFSDLLSCLDSWMGLACHSDGISEIQGFFTSFRMTTDFFTGADFFATADFCEVRL
jgi:hypothetical protein